MNSITVNGKLFRLSEEQMEMSLLNYLREELILTGTKNGCEKGLCGSCTVVIDGKAMRSCTLPLKKVIGKSVITIEGMEYRDGKMHPIQQAFLDAGAVQCGFCTPGMVLGTYALLLSNPEPSREQIRKALRGNLCRCTGYQQIVDAVELSAERIKADNISIEAGCLKN